MREDQFRHWLAHHSGVSSAAQDNALSRCRRIESFEGDLDEHYSVDKCAAILLRFVYSADDERKHRTPRHVVPISRGANIRNGTASLSAAIRIYRNFRNFNAALPGVCLDRENAHPKATKATKPSNSTTRASLSWPDWNLPPDSDVLQLARVAMPYVRFISTDVVKAIVDDNELHRSNWESQLTKHGIDPSLYLWPRSSCAFPGVRRYAGAKEIQIFRNDKSASQIHNQALALDDNHFPKDPWSFVLRGKPFQNQGPSGYALAHLVDHKAYKSRSQDELVLDAEGSVLPTLHGLFTCLTNSVFLPNNLIRPTDFSFALRNLLQRMAASLYSNVCNLLPPGMSFKTETSSEWSLSEFNWAPTVGTVDNIPLFLEYRFAKIEKLMQREESVTVVR